MRRLEIQMAEKGEASTLYSTMSMRPPKAVMDNNPVKLVGKLDDFEGNNSEELILADGDPAFLWHVTGWLRRGTYSGPESRLSRFELQIDDGPSSVERGNTHRALETVRISGSGVTVPRFQQGCRIVPGPPGKAPEDFLVFRPDGRLDRVICASDPVVTQRIVPEEKFVFTGCSGWKTLQATNMGEDATSSCSAVPIFFDKPDAAAAEAAESLAWLRTREMPDRFPHVRFAFRDPRPDREDVVCAVSTAPPPLLSPDVCSETEAGVFFVSTFWEEPGRHKVFFQQTTRVSVVLPASPETTEKELGEQSSNPSRRVDSCQVACALDVPSDELVAIVSAVSRDGRALGSAMVVRLPLDSLRGAALAGIPERVEVEAVPSPALTRSALALLFERSFAGQSAFQVDAEGRLICLISRAPTALNALTPDGSQHIQTIRPPAGSAMAASTTAISDFCVHRASGHLVVTTAGRDPPEVWSIRDTESLQKSAGRRS